MRAAVPLVRSGRVPMLPQSHRGALGRLSTVVPPTRLLQGQGGQT
jgi:hypothetical protein